MMGLFYYNEEIKKRFLNSYKSEDSRKFATLPLMKAKDTEELLNKDIHEMNIDEIENIIRSLGCSTYIAAYNNIIEIERYIDWASTNGYRKTSLNPITNRDKVAWAKTLVVNYKTVNLTRSEIMVMKDDLANVNDRAVLLAIFEGVRGKRYSELINLRQDSIIEEDQQFSLNLNNDEGEQRTIPISSELADLLTKADKMTAYQNGNGLSEGIYAESDFEDSPYIFKRARRGGGQSQKLTYAMVTRKFTLYKDVFNLEYLKPQDIAYSGMRHMANELHKIHGKFTPDLARLIGDQFDIGGDSRNVSVIRNIVSHPDFKKAYGYELKLEGWRK